MATICTVSWGIVARRRNIYQDQRKVVYLYRGVDEEGQTIDFFLSEHRDIVAAKRFLQWAVEKCGVPQTITLDGYTASHTVVAELQEAEVLPKNLIVRTNRYLNNLIEQEHRQDFTLGACENGIQQAPLIITSP